MPFHTFCSAKFSTCIAVRILKFSVLHGKGESKYRPVATNFQCLKMFCHMVCHLLGSAFPKPCSSVALVSAQKRRVALHSPLHPGAGIYHFHSRSNMAEMKSTNVHARENRNDTPRKRKTHIINVRVTAEEQLRIAYACKELHLTQMCIRDRGWRGLCNATRRIRTNGAKLEQGLGKALPNKTAVA